MHTIKKYSAVRQTYITKLEHADIDSSESEVARLIIHAIHLSTICSPNSGVPCLFQGLFVVNTTFHVQCSEYEKLMHFFQYHIHV